jgi:hypothetical protein
MSCLPLSDAIKLKYARIYDDLTDVETRCTLLQNFELNDENAANPVDFHFDPPIALLENTEEVIFKAVERTAARYMLMVAEAHAKILPLLVLTIEQKDAMFAEHAVVRKHLDTFLRLLAHGALDPLAVALAESIDELLFAIPAVRKLLKIPTFELIDGEYAPRIRLGIYADVRMALSTTRVAIGSAMSLPTGSLEEGVVKRCRIAE